MSPPTKHDSITQLLAERLAAGAYLHGQLPGERALAAEWGVSYLTARKATRQLVKDGLLARMSNGRLAPKAMQSKSSRGPKIGLLVDTFPDRPMREWLAALDRVVAAQQGSLHLISYSHESDPRVFEALDANLDGLFVLYRYEPSLLLKERFRQNSKRLVSLWFDMTSMGIPSVENAPPHFVSKAVDHLKNLGHQRVDFLSVSLRNPVLGARISCWQQAVEDHQLQGELFEQSDFDLGSSGLDARQYAIELHQSGKLDQTTAVVCGTTEMAAGFQRGCHEVGREVGRDISVIGFGLLEVAQLSVPAITAIRPGPREPLLEQGLQWITSQGQDWNKSLHITSADVDLFLGESTGPPCVEVTGC